MMKSCKIVLLLLFFFSGFANAFSIQFPAHDTVYVERGIPSHIVVARGCFEKSFPVDEEIGENETQEQLLARIYGSQPLADSSAVYKAWAESCYSVKSSNYSFFVIFSIGAVSTATGFLLYNHDYDYRATEVLGKGSGAILLATGFISLVASLFWLMLPNTSHLFQEQGAIYNEKAEKWKLRVTPTINFNEPGGGLLLQLGF